MMTLANNPFAFEGYSHRKQIVLNNIQHHEVLEQKERSTSLASVKNHSLQ